MSDFVELVQAMDALVQRFGIAKCRFAIEVSRIKCSNVPVPVARKSTVVTLRLEGRKLLHQLALLYCMDSGSKMVNVDIYPGLSKTVADALLVTLDHHHRYRQLTPADKQSSLGDLCVNNMSSNIAPILNHPLVGTIFQHIYVSTGVGQKNHGVQQELLQLTNDVFSSLDFALHQGCCKKQELAFDRLLLSPKAAMILRRLVEDGCVGHLSLDDCKFSKEAECAKILCEGFKNISRFSSVSSSTACLENFESNGVYWKVGSYHDCIVKSLAGIRTLTKLQIEQPFSRELTEAVTHVLMNPLCCIETLILRDDDLSSIWGITYSGKYLDQECSEAFCAALLQSRVADLSIEYDRSDELNQELLRLAVSPHCPIECLTSSMAKFWGDRICINAAVADEVERWSTEQPPPPSRIRRLGLIHGSSMHGPCPPNDSIDVRSQIRFWLPLVSSGRLPYVIEFMGWDGVASRYDIDEETKAVLDELGLWLERNYCGRALLHPYWSNRVPPGLWPLVLANAVKEKSLRCFRTNDNPPFDGIFHLLQGMIQGGHICGKQTPGFL